MRQLLEFIKRNMKIYLRDRGAVFFSLLSMIIVIALMVFFLGDMNVNSITNILGEFPGRDGAADKEHAKLLVLVWTCAGVIPINGVTVTLAALSGMIKDKTSGRLQSIYTAPVSRFTVAAGYVCAAWLCSVIVCGITLAFTEIYCVIQGMEIFSVVTHLKLFGMIGVNSFTYATMMYAVALLAKTEGAWSGLGTVVGTLVGFLGGIYIPVGSLADGIVAVMKCTPVLYGTAMFRAVMTEKVLADTFCDMPEELITEYSDAMGITLQVAGYDVSAAAGFIILTVFGVIFLLLGTGLTKGKKA